MVTGGTGECDQGQHRCGRGRRHHRGGRSRADEIAAGLVGLLENIDGHVQEARGLGQGASSVHVAMLQGS